MINRPVFYITFLLLSIIVYFQIKRYLNDFRLKVFLITLSISLIFNSFFSFDNRSIFTFLGSFSVSLVLIFFLRKQLLPLYQRSAAILCTVLILLIGLNLIGGNYTREYDVKPIKEYDEFEKFYSKANFNYERYKNNNIYHLIFDQVTGKRFEYNFKYSEPLGENFTFYPNAITPYGNTSYSINSVIQARYMYEGETINDFTAKEKWRKYAGKNFSDIDLGVTPNIKRLQEMGYKVTLSDSFKISESDFRSENEIFGAYDVGAYERLFQQYKIFFHQYLWAIAPKTFTSWGLYRSSQPRYIMNDMRGLNHFLNFVKKKTFPIYNNYFLLYFRFPHPPYIFDKTCHYTFPTLFTSYDDQKECFLYKVKEITATLNKKHPDGNFLLIIHSDHGDDLEERHNSFLFSNFPKKKKTKINFKHYSTVDLFPAIFDYITDKKFDFDEKYEVEDLKEKPFFYIADGEKPSKFFINSKTFKLERASND